jgi:hypothetical protein
MNKFFLFSSFVFSLILVVCFDKIYISLLKEVVQFKYINLCGGGLGEKMQCSFRHSKLKLLQTQLKYYRKTQYFEEISPKKFREIQVILSEDQLIWFYQTFFSNHELKFLSSFNKSHGRIYEVKIRPKFY